MRKWQSIPDSRDSHSRRQYTTSDEGFCRDKWSCTSPRPHSPSRTAHTEINNKVFLTQFRISNSIPHFNRSTQPVCYKWWCKNMCMSKQIGIFFSVSKTNRFQFPLSKHKKLYDIHWTLIITLNLYYTGICLNVVSLSGYVFWKTGLNVKSREGILLASTPARASGLLSPPFTFIPFPSTHFFRLFLSPFPFFSSTLPFPSS